MYDHSFRLDNMLDEEEILEHELYSCHFGFDILAIIKSKPKNFWKIIEIYINTLLSQKEMIE